MGERGLPKDVSKLRGLREGIRDYFAKCDSEGVFPDYKGMLGFMRVTEKQLQKAIANMSEKDREQALDMLDKAKDMRESWLCRKMTSEPKLANGCLSALKQEANGGWMDKPSEVGKVTLDIKVNGVGGMGAFK